jgi:hypothetical protein
MEAGNIICRKVIFFCLHANLAKFARIRKHVKVFGRTKKQLNNIIANALAVSSLAKANDIQPRDELLMIVPSNVQLSILYDDFLS